MNTRSDKKQQFSVPLGNEEVIVTLQASRRKSMKLQLNAQGQVEVRIPLGMPKASVLTFLSKHHQWLLERRHYYKQLQQQRSEFFYYHGVKLTFQPASVATLTPNLEQHCCFYPTAWSEVQLAAQLDAFLRQQAYVHYEHLISRWWPVFQHAAQRPTVRVKKMRTRWGSLSKRGYINLNLALMALPENLQELVVVHELCHLRHFDHGPGFKALLRQCLPEVESLERALTHWEKQLLI